MKKPTQKKDSPLLSSTPSNGAYGGNSASASFSADAGQSISPSQAAGAAFLLEVAERFGLLRLLLADREFTLGDALEMARPEVVPVIPQYLEALLSGNLLVATAVDSPMGTVYQPSQELVDSLEAAGYASWCLSACRALIDNAVAYAVDPSAADLCSPRDGRAVAESSAWIGDSGFYGPVVHEIVSRNPSRIVDLGSGAGELLLRVLAVLPGATAVGVDASTEACELARQRALERGLGERLEVIPRPVQDLGFDDAILQGADVVHAGFVLHDLNGDEDEALDRLLSSCAALGPDTALFLTEAAPYVAGPGEATFSAAFSFAHELMGVELMGEGAWTTRLQRAGFDVTCRALPMPGARLYVCTPQERAVEEQQLDRSSS